MKITAEPNDRTIVLRLNEQEAGILLKICGRISGSPSNSPRKVASAIYDELEELGVVPVGRIYNRNSLSFYSYDDDEGDDRG